MDVTPLVKQGQQIIQNYSSGRFKISGQIYEGGVLVTPSSTFPWAIPSDFKNLSLDDFAPLIDMAQDIDVVLLGTGSAMQFLQADLKNGLKEKGVSCDVMDTGAACRTYNVLMAEGRRVAALLFPYV